MGRVEPRIELFFPGALFYRSAKIHHFNEKYSLNFHCRISKRDYYLVYSSLLADNKLKRNFFAEALMKKICDLRVSFIAPFPSCFILSTNVIRSAIDQFLQLKVMMTSGVAN